MSEMFRFWGDLSVTKKLFAVVGVMALLIATELFTLLFAMEVLSAVRSFVGGEGLWSKAQKNAVHALHRYAFTRDPQYYAEFHKHLQVSLGDRAARLELEKPVFDFNKVRDGFVQGGNAAEDVPGIVNLIRRFYWVPYLDHALKVWRGADIMIQELVESGESLHQAIRDDGGRARIDAALANIDRLNERLTVLENEFSQVLGEGSRWLEHVLMILLIAAVLTVESTGLVLTFIFSRNLSRSLKELTDTASAVGRGNFALQVPVRSRDELGQLAAAINKMSADLKTNTGLRREAESASHLKSQFLANMSHEIRTPLGVILGLSEILRDPKLGWQEQLRYVDTIERTGQDLTRIVNDILDLSKVEAGHLIIESSRFSLAEFMDELYSMLSVQAGKTGNRLSFITKGPGAAQIKTDRTRLRQILVNLVNNALKYTRQGEVQLSYLIEDGMLVCDVRDTGRGIEAADRERVFEAFMRSSDAEHTEGHGLGLMLSQKLARALGGDVVLLDSQPGRGSLFRLTVRLEEVLRSGAAVAAAEKPAVRGELRGKKVLVVEDSEDNQLLVELFLCREGLKVDFAHNGKEGFEKAMAGDYDAILMDMQMPIMDGYRATQLLREQGYSRPIIALTAHAMKEDRDRCLRAGCSDYLSKPVDSAALCATIARQIDGETQIQYQ